MFTKEEDVESRTYVHVAQDAPIRVRRHRDDDDIVSVRFGDEHLVLELDEGIVPRLLAALSARD